MTLLDEIAAAVADFKPFEHPRFVNGQLLLTSDEYEALVRKYGQPKYQRSTAQRLLSSIPLTVVSVDGRPTSLNGGKVAVCNKAISNDIYVFDHLDTIIDIPSTLGII